MAGERDLYENPLIQSFSWADATEGLTIEQLKARRAVAAALASRSRPYPTTIGQGIASLGEGIGEGIYGRNLARAEAAQHASDVKKLEESRTPTPPAVPVPPAGTTSAISSEAQKTVAALDETPDPVSTMVADASPVPRADIARTALARQGVLPPGGSAALPGPNPPSQPLAGPEPLRTRYAALNTGTMSDAGQPGATYGGPAPAGPGASTAEPPVMNPPAPSAPPSAAVAAAQPPGPAGTAAPGVAGGGPAPVPRAALAGQVLAQAGVTPSVPGRPAPPVAAPAPAPITAAPLAPRGQPVSPGPDLGPGGARIDPSRPPPETPPAPPREDTPAMARNRAIRNDPKNFGRIGAGALEQLDREYNTRKEARDKLYESKTEQWQKLRDFNNEWAKAHREHIIKAPGEQTKQQQEQAKVDVLMRWGSPERKKTAEEAADKSGDAARSHAEALPQLYKAIDLVKQDKVLSGFLAGEMGLGRPGGYINVPVGSPKLMGSKVMTEIGLGDWSRPFGKSGPPRTYREEVASTEEYQSLIRGVLMGSLKAYGGNPSNADLAALEQQYGLSMGLDRESKLRTLENIKNDYLEKIKGHHSRLSKEFNIPAQDRATLERNQIDVPHDPSDIERLRVALRSGASEANINETINRFDRVYGPGEARKALMAER